MKKNLLLINGSRHGISGQSRTIADFICRTYQADWHTQHLTLQNEKDVASWQRKISEADAFIFLSGTYWDSWGSPLQFFLEESTQWETSDLWMGKPAAVIITMHSIGGKGVLSKLQGVLNTFGLILPPLTGMVYSLNSHLALEGQKAGVHAPDLWSLEDLDTVLANLRLAEELCSSHKAAWKKWPVDKESFGEKWLFEKDFPLPAEKA